MSAHNVDAVRAGLLALALVAGAFCGVALAEVRDPDGVAVIIGNRDYGKGRVPEVAFAHRDAEAFKRYVLDVLGYDPANVIDLRDASQAQMMGAFGNRETHKGKVWRYLDPDGGSDVVVFYSGHGVPGQRDRRGYLLPADADPDAVEINGYPIDLLYENLGKLEEAREVRVYLDACFSGDSHRGMLIRAASPVAMSATPPSGAEGLTVLTAASGTQLASWDEEAGHGLFTHHLLDALYGKGDRDGDGRVTAGEVKRYLDRHMTRAARRTYGREQRADLTGERDTVLTVASGGGTFAERPALDSVPSATSEAEEDVSSTRRTEGAEEEPLEARGVEDALGLGRAERVAVQRGLSSLGLEVGPADGLFGRRTRTALRGWQTAKGLEETGYLTGEQAEALMALGREAEAREEAEEARRREAERKAREDERNRLAAADDAAFARAKGAGTVAGYREYLSSGGRHDEDARRLMREAEERERLEPGKVFRDCAECPELVVVPSGSYEMGSPSSEDGRDDDEGPVHRVRIGRAFAVGVKEVTRGEFGRFVSETGRSMGNACRTYEGGEGKERSGRSWRNPGFSQTDEHPVVCVNWSDARAYVEWLSRKTGEGYRLLSESEWEYVARGGTETARYWGESESGQCRYANGADREAKRHNSRWTTVDCDDGYYRTSPVGRYEANGFGLRDVLGNVWEWVEDCWNGSYRGAPTDGSAWESGRCGRRVLRGGSWSDGPGDLRSAGRGWNTTGGRVDIVGFRVARTLTP